MACKPWRSYLLDFDGWCKLRILCPCQAKLRISQIPFRIWTKTYARIYVPSIKSIHAVRKPVEECFKKRRFWRTPYMIVSPAIDSNLSSCSRGYPHILSHSNKLLPNPPHAYLIALSLSMAIFSRFITCSIKAIDLSHIPLPPSRLPLSPHSTQ